MKKIWIPILIAAALAVLTIPLPTGVLKDGGTREYTALTYKIVQWKRMTEDTVYEKTSVYLFPDNFKSIDELWSYENDGECVEDPLTDDTTDECEEMHMDYKPVIYLYPEKEMEVSVKLTLDGRLTCTYPSYNESWIVTALPDGTLTDENGQIYNYLYWEGETYAQYDLSKGFCVKGEDTAAFLEYALDELGLTRREANEFIVFWLPMMEHNRYNIISFQTDVYTEAAQLEVNPAPDTLIRVFMAWQAADEYIQIPEQELSRPEREGFTVVEWGGTEIKK